MITILLIVLLIVLLLGVAGTVPVYPYSRQWGYGPSLVQIILIIIIVLLLIRLI